MDRVWSVVVAGGSGQRFGRLKQFEVLAGRPMLEWAVAACRNGSEGVVVVVPDGGHHVVAGADIVVTGGATRSSSVRRGLTAVPDDAEIIVIHDAARPLATAELFETVVGTLENPGVAGAICAIPVSDTLKRVTATAPPPAAATLTTTTSTNAISTDPTSTDAASADALTTVAATVERADLVAVQTPQAFRAWILRAAHAGAGQATDDAGLVEALGATVAVVPGDPTNVKVTTPADLLMAEHLLAARP